MFPQDRIKFWTMYPFQDLISEEWTPCTMPSGCSLLARWRTQGSRMGVAQSYPISPGQVRLDHVRPWPSSSFCPLRRPFFLYRFFLLFFVSLFAGNTPVRFADNWLTEPKRKGVRNDLGAHLRYILYVYMINKVMGYVERERRRGAEEKNYTGLSSSHVRADPWVLETLLSPKYVTTFCKL